MNTLIIPLIVFFSSTSDIDSLKKSLLSIEEQCSISFSIKTIKKNFTKKINHEVFNLKNFSYYEELLKPNYRVFLTNKKHGNFSYNNSVWISKNYKNTTISHELIHMLTGEMEHFGKHHILSDKHYRDLHIPKKLCKKIKKDNWKNPNKLSNYFFP